MKLVCCIFCDQKNQDPGLCRHSVPIQSFQNRQTLEQFFEPLYDIACQYYVHLHDQIRGWLPFGLDIDTAIGLFHVHAHKDQCFFQYASSFIPGAAIVVGEILESLWSSLNAISLTVRTVTLQHRAEMLDDHANNSNHKKCLGIVPTLCHAYQTAVDMLDHAKSYYWKLTEQAGLIAVEKWEHNIQEAETMHKYDITKMDIYAVRFDLPMLEYCNMASRSARSPLASWMELVLVVEEKQ